MCLILGDVRNKLNMLGADFTTWAKKETQFWHRKKIIEKWNFFAWKHSVENIFNCMYCLHICFLISCSVFFVMYVTLIL
jgi:hypothetical protein